MYAVPPLRISIGRQSAPHCSLSELITLSMDASLPLAEVFGRVKLTCPTSDLLTPTVNRF